MFCPFIKNECKLDCVFNDSGNNKCKLLTTIVNIESNTSSDQTESWSINNKLGDALDKLDCIINIIKKI